MRSHSPAATGMTRSKAGPSIPQAPGSVSSGTQGKQLRTGAGPAVGEDQRYPPAGAGPLMDEVDLDSIELGPELRVGVQSRFLGPPVESIGPVGEQALQVIQVGALPPGGTRGMVRPTRHADARPKVRDHGVVDPDREGLDRQGGPVHGSRSTPVLPRPGGCRSGRALPAVRHARGARCTGRPAPRQAPGREGGIQRRTRARRITFQLPSCPRPRWSRPSCPRSPRRTCPWSGSCS